MNERSFACPVEMVPLAGEDCVVYLAGLKNDERSNGSQTARIIKLKLRLISRQIIDIEIDI